ncbi:hypothetical protein JQC72_13345, partial [Polycladomyces sp. WAk]
EMIGNHGLRCYFGCRDGLIGELIPTNCFIPNVKGLNSIWSEMACMDSLILDVGIGDGFGCEMIGNHGLWCDFGSVDGLIGEVLPGDGPVLDVM